MKPTMKKLLAMFAIAISALTLSSCDEDAEVAYLLEGAWRGDMHVYSSYNGHEYAATYSEIEFYSGYDSGTGVWVDHYSGAPWDYVANHITWRVRDENIYIHFVEEGTDAVIYDYSLSDNYFSGYLEVMGGDYAYFRLTKIYSPNWDDYYNWGYDDWYDWNKADNDSLPVTRSAPNAGETPKRLFK